MRYFGLFTALFLLVQVEIGSTVRPLVGGNIDLVGAWTTTEILDGHEVTHTAIVAGGYISVASYSVTDQMYYGTAGGQVRLNDGRLEITYEYNDRDTSMVGITDTISLLQSEEAGTIRVEGYSQPWVELDDGAPGLLADAYLITGRMSDGKLSSWTPGARKTMKILSGTRFQWIAYNDVTRQFMGTGGGTYTSIDGVYTEHIEFFSRDGSRVGADLEFTYDIRDGEWHHSGLSSKGQPIYEVWSPRNTIIMAE